MGLPDHELKDTYTHDEVQHIVAREWAKQEILRLANGQMELQRTMIEVTGQNSAELKGLRELLTGFPSLVSEQVSRCRKDLRAEIENEFPTKLESLRMEQRIEDKIGATDTTLGKQISALDKKVDSLEGKVDKQWLKITVIVGTIVGIGGVVQWLLATGNALIK